MKGRRIYPDKGEEFKPGDYGQGSDELWYCRPPNPEIHLGNLRAHQVEEHEDGTITVSPSILIEEGTGGPLWHGWLKKGEWTEA
ncbi:hypothetical protein LCGC14_1206560 [marine sediment metagenome]|uniref:Uncharacterized protein n=1 Tax=marine sediment metagenome TaxID=412755 RepID=A0A0F9NXK1_9ZZZZ